MRTQCTRDYFHFKGKTASICEETVDARDWLWKAMENAGKTTPDMEERGDGHPLVLLEIYDEDGRRAYAAFAG